MANVSITDLTALGARPSTDDYFVIVDSSEALDADKTKKVAYQYVGPTFLQTRLASTDYDGDSFSTTVKTKIDLSAVFGVPAGVKAIWAEIVARDSGSSGAAPLFGIAPTTDAGVYATEVYLEGVPNDDFRIQYGLCPCDSNGDVYYGCTASGAGTLDVYLRIWGYWM